MSASETSTRVIKGERMENNGSCFGKVTSQINTVQSNLDKLKNEICKRLNDIDIDYIRNLEKRIGDSEERLRLLENRHGNFYGQYNDEVAGLEERIKAIEEKLPVTNLCPSVNQIEPEQRKGSEMKLKSIKQLTDSEANLADIIVCKKCGYWVSKWVGIWDSNLNFVCHKCNRIQVMEKE